MFSHFLPYFVIALFIRLLSHSFPHVCLYIKCVSAIDCQKEHGVQIHKNNTLSCLNPLSCRGFTRASEVPGYWGGTHRRPTGLNGTGKITTICAQAATHLTSWPASSTGQDSGESANKEPVHNLGHRRSSQGYQGKTQASWEGVGCKLCC